MLHMIYFILCFVITVSHSQLATTERDCHCFDEPCVKILGEWKCQSWTCDRGWYNAPYCNLECEPNYYGISCEKQCHCPPGDTCDSVSGLCGSGKCADGYHGAGCQILLPRLSLPPEVEPLNCSTLLVSWGRWNESTDDGSSSDIANYTVQYCKGSEGTNRCLNGSLVNSIPDIIEPSDPSVLELSTMVTQLDSNTGYVVTVRTNRLEDGKQVNGRKSDYAFARTCLTTTTSTSTTTTTTSTSTTTTPTTTPTTTTTTPTTTTTTPTTTTPIVPLPVNDVVVSVNATALNLAWSLPSTHSDLITIGLSINYTRLRYQACVDNSALAQESTIVNLQATEVSMVRGGLSPYSDYVYSITIEYIQLSSGSALHSIPVSGTFQTMEAAPSEAVSNLTVEDTGTSWIHMSWGDYPCQYWGSITLTRYELEVARIGPNTKYNVSVVAVTEHNITALLPNVEYSLRIRPITRGYVGVWSSSLTARTTNSVPPPVSSVDITSKTVSSFTIRTTQSSTTVAVDYYNITYQKVKAESCGEETLGPVILIGPILVRDRTKQITNLAPYTRYSVTVITVNEAGSSSYNLEVVTSGQAPLQKLTTGHSANTSPDVIRFIWQPIVCTQLYGVLTGYDVLVFNNGNLAINTSTTEGFVEISQVVASSVYQLRVRAVNDYGSGPWSDDYNLTSGIVSAPQPVTNLRLQSSGNSSLTLTWGLPSQDGNQAARYRLRYSRLRYAGPSCPVTVTQDILVEIPGQSTTYTLQGLESWSVYNITIEAGNDRGLVLTHRIFETEPALPGDTLIITSHTESVPGYEVMLYWAEPACSLLLGTFMHYQYRVTTSAGREASPSTGTITDSGATELNITVLPNTIYSVQLQLTNELGSGDFGTAYQFTSSNVAPKTFTLNTPTVTADMVTVSWSRPANDMADDVLYNITLTRLKLSTCSVDNTGSVRSVVQTVNQRSRIFSSLHPYSDYQISVVASNDAGSVERKTQFSTLPKPPAKSVDSLRVTNRQQTILSYSWTRLACEELTAEFLSYTLHLTDLTNGVDNQTVTDHTGTTWTAINLKPYTTYRLTVSLHILGGLTADTSDSIDTRTLEAVPAAPGDITVEQIESGGINISWTPPATERGDIEDWLVQYTVNNIKYNETVAPSQRYYLIANPQPYTVYSDIRVRARSSAGLGDPITIEDFTTRPAIPDKPVDVFGYTQNTSCVTIRWRQPSKPSGVIDFYKLDVRQLSNPTGTVNNTLSNVNVSSVSEQTQTYSLCELQSGSQYHVSVSAYTRDAGEGPADNTTAWTRIGTPLAPRRPGLVSVAATTIKVRLYPVVASVGPVTYYELRLRDEHDENTTVTTVDVTDNSTELVISRRKRQTVVSLQDTRLYANFTPQDWTGGAYYDFDIGDNRTTRGVYNKPLKPSTAYTIYHVVVSSQNGAVERSYTSRTTFTDDSVFSTRTPVIGGGGVLTDGWIVAIALLALVVLALLILMIWCIYRSCRRRRGKGLMYKPYEMESPTSQSVYTPRDPSMTSTAVYTGYWSPAYELGDRRHIVLEETELSKDLTSEKPYITFEQEFNNLPRGQTSEWHTAALHPHLNRVSHLVAYDFNRVQIDQSPIGIDYINASYIDGFNNKKNKYIATTSPYDEDCAIQFWQMIYEQKVTKIIMMTNMIDEGIVKCVQYWPEKEGDEEVFENIMIQLTSIEVYAHFNIYRMKLRHVSDMNSVRHISQFHYTGWPEHGVPRTTFPMLDFRSAIYSTGRADSSPLVVHCGTGCSTTGFFIALDYVVEQAASHNEVSVFKAVSYIRSCRTFMVRTLKQYLYIYDCVFEHLLGGGKELSHDLKTKFKLLSNTNPQTGQSYFKDETVLLKKFTPRPRKDELSTAATLDVNKPKNRYSSVLPMDSNRVKLSLEHGESDYINAIYYDSYRQSKAFILTQTPMPETLVDFWRMIWEKGVCSIVMMDDDRLHDESCASYWPDVHEKIPISPNSLRAGAGDSTASHLYGQFYVQLLKVQRVEDICITRHMLLTNKLQPHEPSRHVKQFQVLEWPLNQIKPPKTGLPMLRLMDKVEAWHHNVTESYNQTVASPVVVHCLDGAVHSGVYVAAAVICEKMRDENQVNVFLTVKEIKHKRKDAIGTLHQYKYLHRVLWDFINLKLEQRTLDTSNNTYISQRPSAAYQNKLQHSSPPRHDRLQHGSPPRHNISHQDTYESYENESDEVSTDNDQFDVQIRG